MLLRSARSITIGNNQSISFFCVFCFTHTLTPAFTSDGQTSPHRPRLVVSRSTCPPLFPPPREQLCNRYCSKKHTQSLVAVSSTCTQALRHNNREGPHHTTGVAPLASEGRHRCVGGRGRQSRVHSATLQYQAHCQVLPHTLAGVSSGH